MTEAPLADPTTIATADEDTAAGLATWRATHPGTTDYSPVVLIRWATDSDDTLAKPPAGAMALAWDLLLTEHPDLDGARICDTGHLDVELERTMGTAERRTSVVQAVAATHGAEMQPACVDGEKTTHWTRFDYAGVLVIVHTKVCTCHPEEETRP